MPGFKKEKTALWRPSPLFALICSGHLQTATARKQGQKSAASRRYARQTCTSYGTRNRSGIGECIDVAKSVQAINRKSCIYGKRKYIETLIGGSAAIMNDEKASGSASVTGCGDLPACDQRGIREPGDRLNKIQYMSGPGRIAVIEVADVRKVLVVRKTNSVVNGHLPSRISLCPGARRSRGGAAAGKDNRGAGGRNPTRHSERGDRDKSKRTNKPYNRTDNAHVISKLRIPNRAFYALYLRNNKQPFSGREIAIPLSLKGLVALKFHLWFAKIPAPRPSRHS